MATRIFNIIGWLGTVLVFAAVAIRLGLPSQNRYAYYLAWAGLACMVIYTFSQWREIARLFARRQARQGTLAATSVLIVLGILVAINYIAKQQSKRWDLTAAKQYTLSDQSRNILAKLDAPLEILVFDRETEFQRFRDRLREYESGSKQVKTEYVDPDRKPTVAQQHAVQQYGTIVLNYKGRTERVTTDTEQDITNGIIKSVVFGVAVSLIAVFEGYDAKPTAEGVSAATTRTVVGGSLAILALDFVLTVFMFRGMANV